MKVERDLEHYLKQEILPQLAAPPYGELQAVRLSNTMPVYLVTDPLSQVKLVTKSFQYGSIPLDTAWKRAELEYGNLKNLREKYKMNEGAFKIISPLGKKRELFALLVIEFGKGNTLDHYINDAIRHDESEKLYKKLKLLAGFLVKLHGNSQSERHTSPILPQKYLKKLLRSLKTIGLIDEHQESLFKELSGLWWSRNEIFNDYEVVVHGDATTSNFLFHHHEVTGIDVEKTKSADRCWDLGFLAAELKHHFLNETNSTLDSEPYIKHLLVEYTSGFPDHDMFKSVTRRLPLFMSLGLLRIARNGWLSEKHRGKLVDEAKLCLKYKD